MKKFYLLASLMAISTSLLGSEEIKTNKLEETVITSENFESTILDTAKDITIITQEEIQNKGATTIAQALEGAPGVIVKYMDGSDAKFDLRGFGATNTQNTLVLLDGVPLNNSQNGEYFTSQIPISMIEKIEIVPSGGSIMYGEGAVGGVINIITKTPKNKKNYGSANLEYASWKTLNGSATYGTKFSNNLLFNIAYSGYKTDGYRHSNINEYDNPDRNQAIWARTKYLFNSGSLEASYRHNNNKDFYTSSLSETEYNKNPKQANSSYGGFVKFKQDNYLFKYNQSLSNDLDLVLYGGYDKIKFHGSWSKYNTSQLYFKPQIKYTYGDNNYIIFGGDTKNGKTENKSINEKDKKRKTYAAYILNKITIDKVQFTQGFRHEKIDYSMPGKITSTKFNKNSWELTANYLYSDTGSIYLSYNNAFRTPTIQDINAWSGKIKAQENNTYEIGLKDIYNNTYISTSVFKIDSENEIIYDKKFLIGYSGSNRNFDGKIERLGAQLALQHYFDKLILRENFTYINAKIKSGDYNQKHFPGIPKWNINLGTTYNINDNLTFNLDMYYLSKTYIEDDFKNQYGQTNSHTIFDTNIKYRISENIEFYTGIKNIFNKKYADAIFGGTSKSYYPANGRQYYAGFRYNF